jgi:tetratricopeptide (TPR) repeat protein
MNYFNGALEQDSNYSLAYAGLAEAYMALPYCSRYSWKDAYTMSKKYVLKALGIDNSLVQAHATYGAIESTFKTNWKFAEKELLKAIELNSNYADAYQFYAEYLHSTGKFDEAFVNINKAIELDPNSYGKYNIRSNIYQFKGNLMEALKDDEKLLEINKNDKWAIWRNFDIYVQLGEDLKAINELKKFLELDDPGKDFEDQLNHVYADSGIKGIYLWCINYFKLKKWEDHFLIAAIYGKISAREQTLENLEKAYEQYEKGETIMMIKLKTRYEFKYLYGDPRFNALLEKLNLPVD